MKTAELIGVELDYYVAMANGWRLAKPWPEKEFESWCVDGDIKRSAWTVNRGQTALPLSSVYSPSADWSKGGPVIEHANITVQNAPELGLHQYKWTAIVISGGRPVDSTMALGPTYLVAAMRCYVTSKFGDEVPEVPNLVLAD